MFQLAIDARIPIISVSTGDLVNLEATLEHYVGEPLARATDWDTLLTGIKKGDFTYILSPADYDWAPVYHAIAEMPSREPVVIVVNPADRDPSFFDVGLLPTPKALLRSLLSKCVDKACISDLLRVLSGVTLKEASELIALATAQHGELTPQTVAAARRNLPLNLRGLSIVDTEYAHYSPILNLDSWVHRQGKLFMMNGEVPQAIVPRGVLFRGATGTGKTMAAKFIGKSLGLPVYRLDIAAALNKYIGESEGNVQAALNHVETLAPCVLFIDEVEKVFRKEDDSGTSGRILSSLLWWLQEHKSRVLTIMTCNDDTKIPKELTRKGRITSEFTLHGIEKEHDQLKFIMKELKSLNAPKKCMEFAHDHFLISLDTSQAALADEAREYLRNHLLNH